MSKKKDIVEVSNVEITSKDVMNFIGGLVSVFVFAKKLYDYYKHNK